MKSYYIPIHSYSSLITNSSSEIYVQATEKTVEAFKEIINASLQLAGSELKADDLFEFELRSNSTEFYDYDSGSTIDIPSLNLLNSEEKERFQNLCQKAHYNTNVSVVLKPKDKSGANKKQEQKISELISNLRNTFNIYGYCN